MVLFGKRISMVLTLNCFSEKEQSSYRQSMLHFYQFLKQTKILHFATEIREANDLHLAMRSMKSDLHSGILINFLGHGDSHGIGNNVGLYVPWTDIINQFQTLNTNDAVVVNTAIMCHGIGLFSHYSVMPKPFHAAFGTNNKTNAESFWRTVDILKNCLIVDNVANSISEVNRELEKTYELDDIEMKAQQVAKEQGIPFEPITFTQFSFIS